jgi:predicted Zn-dependent protease with MMP-like domain
MYRRWSCRGYPRAVPPSPPPRRRDRHGRGLRGPLAPAELPLTRSRATRFDDHVLDAVERLEQRWAQELAGVELAVEDVPSPEAVEEAADTVPLARLLRGARGLAPRIVVFRRPLEARAAGDRELGTLVHDVIVEQVADLLGVDPETVDPHYADRYGDDD